MSRMIFYSEYEYKGKLEKSRKNNVLFVKSNSIF